MLENRDMAYAHPRCCIRFIKHERKMCDAKTLSPYEQALLFEAWPRDQVGFFQKNKQLINQPKLHTQY